MAQTENRIDPALLAARFVPALHLNHDREWAARLLELASTARAADGAPPADKLTLTPAPPPHNLPDVRAHCEQIVAAAVAQCTPAERAEWLKWKERVTAIVDYSHLETRGLNPADEFIGILFAHHDPKTLAWISSLPKGREAP